MPVAALYDIHGNLPALEAVLAEIPRTVTHIVVGGDLFPGPMAQETLERLLGLGVPVAFIHGNAETAILGELDGTFPKWYIGIPESAKQIVKWAANHLSADHARVMRTWPRTHRLDVDGLGSVVFCHATPRDENEIFTRLTPEERLLPIFDAAKAAVVVCGHTHMQFDRMIGRTRVVNAGSVGMPFGPPGADWLLLGPDVQLRHTSYDLSAAAEQIRRTDYIDAENFAADYVLNPAPEARMLEEFTRAQLV